MNKKTKLLSIFVLAGVISTGVAVGVTGCKKHKHNWSAEYTVQENGKHAKTCDGCDKLLDEHDATWTDDSDTTCDHDGCDVTRVVTPDGATVTAVTVSAAGGATSVAVGATLQLSASVTGTNNPAQTVTWSTESDKVEVSSSGLVTGKTATAENEKVTIKATSTADPTKYGEIQLTVTAATQGGDTTTITSVTVTAAGNATSVMERDILQLTATVDGTGDYSPEVEWTSSDNTKATVDADGKVTGVAACDSVTITATSKADPTKYGSITLSVTAFVDEHAGTKYAEIRDKSNNIIAEDFKHKTIADIDEYEGSLGGTPGIYLDEQEHPNRSSIEDGALVIGNGTECKEKVNGEDVKYNVFAYADFGLIKGVVEGYFEFKFDKEASSGGNSVNFVDAEGNKLLEMIAYGNNSSKHFQFKLNGNVDPVNSGKVAAAANTLYKVYFKLDLSDEGKLTLKINDTTVYEEAATGIDSVAGLQFSTSNGGQRKSIIDNIAVAADQMTATDVKNKLSQALADVKDNYSTGYTKNGALINAAYGKALNAMSAEGATIDEIKAAYKTAVEEMADVLSDEDLEMEGFGGFSERVGMVLGGLLGEFVEEVNIYDDIEIDGTVIKGNAPLVYEAMNLQGLVDALTYEATDSSFAGKIRTMSDLKAWAEEAKTALESADIPTDSEIIAAVKQAINAHIDKLIDAAKAENADAADALEALRTTLKGNVTEAADEYDATEHNAEEVVEALKEIDDEIEAAIQQAIADSSKSLSDLQSEYNGKLDEYAAQILAEEAAELKLPSAPEGLTAAVNAVRDEWKQTINSVTEEDKNTIPGLFEDGKDALDKALEEYKQQSFEITVKIGGDIKVSNSAKTYATISRRYGDWLTIGDIRINGFNVTKATVGSTTLENVFEGEPIHVTVYGNLEVTVTEMNDSYYTKEEKWKVTAENVADGESNIIGYGNSLFSFTSMEKATNKTPSVTIDGETFTNSVASVSIPTNSNNEETPYYIYASATLKTLTIYNALCDSAGTGTNRCGTIYYSINDGEPVVVKTLTANGDMRNACVIENVPVGANIKLWAENTSSNGGATLHIYGIYATIDEESIPETVKVHWGTDVQEHWYRHGDQITAPEPTEDDLDGKEFDYWKFTCSEEEGHYHGDRWENGMSLGSGEHTLIAETREAVPVETITIEGAGIIGVGDGSSITLTVNYNGGDGDDSLVAWSITAGGDKASIVGGVLTLNDTAVAGDTITVKAVYNSEDSISDTKTINVIESEESYLSADIEDANESYDAEDNNEIIDGTLYTLYAEDSLNTKASEKSQKYGDRTDLGGYNLYTEDYTARTSHDVLSIVAKYDITIYLYVTTDKNNLDGARAATATVTKNPDADDETTTTATSSIGGSKNTIDVIEITLKQGETALLNVTGTSGNSFTFYFFGIEVGLTKD